MSKKMYETGLMARVSPAEFDFGLVEEDEDFTSVKEARKRAKELSKKCPFKDYHGRQIDAIDITCHSENEMSSYWQHWRETYVGGKMVFRINFSEYV